MSDKNLVIIKPFNVLGNDAKGFTADFSLPRKQSDFVFLTRSAGSLSGNTFHQGTTDGTNPKLFILAAGEIRFSYRKYQTQQKYVETVTGPSLIEVKANVIHSVEAITDVIMFECNSIKDIQQDRIREEV